MPSELANDIHNIINKLIIMDKIRNELKKDMDDFISCKICEYI